MTQKRLRHSVFYMVWALLSCVCIVLSGSAQAQATSAEVSQRFVMQVEDMMDMGFVNESEKYTQNAETEINELNEGKAVEYQFRVRGNEPYRISMNTYLGDDETSTDSLLQVAIPGKNKEEYKEGNNTALIDNTLKTENEILTIKYRTKPGTTLPEGTKVKVMFTASYP